MKYGLPSLFFLIFSLHSYAGSLILESGLSRPLFGANYYYGDLYLKVEEDKLSYSLWVSYDQYFNPGFTIPGLENDTPTHFELYGAGGFSETFLVSGGNVEIINDCIADARRNPFISYPPLQGGEVGCDEIYAYTVYEGTCLPTDFSFSDLPDDLGVSVTGDLYTATGLFQAVSVPEPSIFLLSSLFSFHLLSRRRRTSV